MKILQEKALEEHERFMKDRLKSHLVLLTILAIVGLFLILDPSSKSPALGILLVTPLQRHNHTFLPISENRGGN